ncbi:MAG TPA: hypothetical protein VFR47_21490 [Anaerolineales bacterium]|nr:hypothetical protein [Anaerolineales bacterium]
MRFRDLDQQAVAGLWDRWKYIVQDILEEFNEDVYHGSGIVHENSFYERIYLALETKKACLYIFPIPGDVLLLHLYHGKLAKECLSLNNASSKSDKENLVGWVALEAGRAEEIGATYKEKRWWVEKLVRRLYGKYQVDFLF